MDKRENSGHYIKSYGNKDDHYDKSDQIQSGVKDNVVVSHESHTYTNQHDKRTPTVTPEGNRPPRTPSNQGQKQQRTRSTTPPPPPKTNTSMTTPPTPPRTNTYSGRNVQPTGTTNNDPQKKAPTGCIVFAFCFIIYVMIRACS